MAIKHELLFMTVPPPQSGHIVEYLEKIDHVVESAAVYTDIDVIALVKGNGKSISSTLKKIKSIGSPIQNIERCQIDKVVDGPSIRKGRYQCHNTFFAYIRCAVNEDISFEFIVQWLSEFDFVRFVYPSKKRSEIILQIIASDKILFDKSIMSGIQDPAGMIKYTRTYIVINEMYWSETNIPIGRNENYKRLSTYPVFMGFAVPDKDFACSLVDQVFRDSRVNIWHFGLIKTGAEFWTKEIDSAIENATGYLFVITKDFLESSECQREFGKIEGNAKAHKICCLLHPSIEFKDIPVRYRARQCINGRSFFSYSEVLKWIKGVV